MNLMKMNKRAIILIMGVIVIGAFFGGWYLMTHGHKGTRVQIPQRTLSDSVPHKAPAPARASPAAMPDIRALAAQCQTPLFNRRRQMQPDEIAVCQRYLELAERQPSRERDRMHSLIKSVFRLRHLR